MTTVPSVELPATRELAPFAYYPDHASVISGFGGARSAPDPRYCFHTVYEEYQPGALLFRVRLHEAQSTRGVLAVRVHAFRPESGMNASLVSSVQRDLAGLDGNDVEIPLRITAIPGVTYALYGYMAEESDLRVASLSATATELGGDPASNYTDAEAPPTAFGRPTLAPLRQLVGEQVPSLHDPVCQPFTTAQVESRPFADWLARIAPDSGNPQRRWSAIFALCAVQSFGFLQPGARGLLFGDAQPVLPALGDWGCQLVRIGQQPQGVPQAANCHWVDAPLEQVAQSTERVDFAMAFGTLDGAPSQAEWIDRYNAVMRCLLRGGLSVFLFDYWPRSWGAPPLEESFLPGEPHIARLALYAIAHGSSVAQLLFPSIPAADRHADAGHPFALVALR